MEQNWLIHDVTGSVKESTGWFLVILCHYWTFLVGTWWYWVSLTWYCLVLSETGLVQCFYACIYWKSGNLVWCHHSGTTNKWKRKDRATQSMDHGRLRWAIRRRKIFGTQRKRRTEKENLLEKPSHDACQTDTHTNGIVEVELEFLTQN